jgi:hypothetical protein
MSPSQTMLGIDQLGFEFMKNVYLIAAIVGALVPYAFFLQHFAVVGFDVGAFVRATFANPAASGFAADLLISSAVFWAWMQSRRPGGPSLVPFIALNCLIGLSCALPAYLYVCARRDVEPIAALG